MILGLFMFIMFFCVMCFVFIGGVFFLAIGAIVIVFGFISKLVSRYTGVSQIEVIGIFLLGLFILAFLIGITGGFDGLKDSDYEKPYNDEPEIVEMLKYDQYNTYFTIDIIEQ